MAQMKISQTELELLIIESAFYTPVQVSFGSSVFLMDDSCNEWAVERINELRGIAPIEEAVEQPATDTGYNP